MAKGLNERDVLAIGLISGTSMDGIDACIVKLLCVSDSEISG